MRLLRVRHDVDTTSRVDDLRDLAFLLAYGAVLVGAAHIYAATGWPMPGVIDR